MNEKEYIVVSSMKSGSFSGKFGETYKYATMFEGEDEAVEINQKPETPAPKAGDKITGTIESTQYGKRFKKSQSSGFSKGGFSKSDPISFHVSYAKDMVVAFINAGIIKDTKEAANQWTNFATLAKGLYDKLSKGENPIKTPEKPTQSQTSHVITSNNIPDGDIGQEEQNSPEEETIDISELPF